MFSIVQVYTWWIKIEREKELIDSSNNQCVILSGVVRSQPFIRSQINYNPSLDNETQCQCIFVRWWAIVGQNTGPPAWGCRESRVCPELVPYKVICVRIPMGMSLSAALLPPGRHWLMAGPELLCCSPLPLQGPGHPGNTLSDTRQSHGALWWSHHNNSLPGNQPWS